MSVKPSLGKRHTQLEAARSKRARHAGRVPNAETRAAMEESRAMMAARQPRFASAQALFDDLEKAGKQ